MNRNTLPAFVRSNELRIKKRSPNSLDNLENRITHNLSQLSRYSTREITKEKRNVSQKKLVN